jgi:hypothetical protein
MNVTPSSASPRLPSPAALALLASRAAVALELSSTARDTEWTEVRELGDVLGSMVQGESATEPEHGRQSLVQTEAVDVVDRALLFSGDRRITTVDELSEEVVRLAIALQKASSSTAAADLERLRDLCVALARAAQAQQPVPVYVRPAPGSKR